MADELDPKRQNEEMGTTEEETRDKANDEEEFEDIDDESDEEDNAADVEE